MQRAPERTGKRSREIGTITHVAGVVSCAALIGLVATLFIFLFHAPKQPDEANRVWNTEGFSLVCPDRERWDVWTVPNAAVPLSFLEQTEYSPELRFLRKTKHQVNTVCRDFFMRRYKGQIDPKICTVENAAGIETAQVVFAGVAAIRVYSYENPVFDEPGSSQLSYCVQRGDCWFEIGYYHGGGRKIPRWVEPYLASFRIK